MSGKTRYCLCFRAECSSRPRFCEYSSFPGRQLLFSHRFRGTPEHLLPPCANAPLPNGGPLPRDLNHTAIANLSHLSSSTPGNCRSRFQKIPANSTQAICVSPFPSSAALRELLPPLPNQHIEVFSISSECGRVFKNSGRSRSFQTPCILRGFQKQRLKRKL